MRRGVPTRLVPKISSNENQNQIKTKPNQIKTKSNQKQNQPKLTTPVKHVKENGIPREEKSVRRGLWSFDRIYDVMALGHFGHSLVNVSPQPRRIRFLSKQYGSSSSENWNDYRRNIPFGSFCFSMHTMHRIVILHKSV